MNGKNFAAALVLLHAVADPLVAGQIEGSAISVGSWSGGAWTDTVTGLFSHCVVAAEYESADTLSFSMTASGELVIGLSGAAVSVDPGNTFPATLSVDQTRLFEGLATGYAGNFIAIALPTDPAMFDRLAQGRTLRLDAGGGTATYRLTGSRRALDAVETCQRTFAGFRSAVPDVSGAELIGDAPLGAGIDPAVLFQLSAKMIAALDIKEFRFLTREEVAARGMSGAMIWQSIEVSVEGVVLALRVGETIDLRESDNNDARVLASNCSEDWSLRANDLPNTALPARQVSVQCESLQGGFDRYLLKVHAKPFVIVSMLSFAPSSDPAVLDERQRLLLGLADTTAGIASAAVRSPEPQ